MTEQFPDVEGAVRTWLRNQPAVTAIVGNRVFFGVPKGAQEHTFPLVTVRLISATLDPYVPVTTALIQVDCWGPIDASGNGDKAAAWTLVNTISALFHSIENTTITATTRALGATVESVVWLPDSEPDRPRYSLTAEVQAITPTEGT